MARTIVGVFDTNAAAQQAVDDLIAQGIRRDEISVVARGEETNRAVNDESRAGEDAGFGATAGTALGGALGLLVGIGALAIPGIGPVLAIGPLAAALGSAGAGALIGAGVGAASGGIIGALVGAGVPEDEANIYAESVRRGGVLVAVSNEVLSEATITEVLRRNGAADVNDRSSTWRGEGWKRFDPDAGEYRRDYDSGTGGEIRRDWEESSKVGTAAGTAAGAATGAAIGSVAGPVGTVVGGIAGAVTGAGVGAAGDVAGENAEDAVDGDDGRRNPQRYDTSRTGGTGPKSETPRDWEESSKVGTAAGTATGAATGAAMGSVAGPVGTVVGGIAGAAAGAGIGAAGDVAGENAEDAVDNDARRNPQRYGNNESRTGNPYDTTRRTDYGTGVSPDAPSQYDTNPGLYGDEGTKSETRRDWEESSKVGTAAGTATGAATGAAMGSVAGPVGTVVGGIAGAVAGAGVGAAGDVAGENAEDAVDGDDTTGTRTHRNATDTTGAMTGRKGQVNIDALHAEDDARTAQRQAAGHDPLVGEARVPQAGGIIAASAQNSSGLAGVPVSVTPVEDAAADDTLTEEERRARRERR